MFKFKISKEEARKLDEILSKIGSNFVDKSKAIYVVDPETQKLNFYLYSDTSSLSASVNVFDIQLDTNANYFVTKDLSVLTKRLSTVSEKYSTDVVISIDNDEHSISLKSEGTDTNITVSNFEVSTSDAEVEEAKSFIDNKYNVEFTSNCHTVMVTPELVSTTKILSKAMAETLDAKNTVAVYKDTVKYADDNLVVKRKLPTVISAEEKDIYINKELTDLLAPFIGDTGLEVKLTEDCLISYIEIPTFDVRMILTFMTPSYCSPTEEELADITPTDDNCLYLKVKKVDILNSFAKFGDVFSDSTWREGFTNINFSKEYLDTNKVRIYHEDMLGKVSTTFHVDVDSRTNEKESNYTESGKEVLNRVEFIFRQKTFLNLLNLIDSDDIELKLNRLEIGAQNSLGIKVISDNVDAMICKYSIDE